jgi:hypothetical protein
VDETVLVYLDSVPLFYGSIVSTTERGLGTIDNGVHTVVTAKGNRYLTDQILVSEQYAAGMTLKQIVTDLHTTYLQAFGIGIEAPMDDGPTLEEMTFDYVSMAEVFSRLMSDTGWFIRIVPGLVAGIPVIRRLSIIDPGTVSAAFSLTVSGSEILDPVSVDRSARGRVNRVILRYGTNTVETREDVFIADGTSRRWTLSQTPAGTPSQTGPHPAVYVNGVYNHVAMVTGATSLFEWNFDYSTNELVQFADAPPGTPHAIIPAGIVIQTTPYPVQYPLTVTVEDTASITALGGDPTGVYPLVVDAPHIFDDDEAEQYAEGLLRSGLNTTTTFKAATRQGLEYPGTVIPVHAPNRLLAPSADYLITRVSWEDIKMDDVEYTYTLVSGTEPKQTWTEQVKSQLGGGGRLVSGSVVPAAGTTTVASLVLLESVTPPGTITGKSSIYKDINTGLLTIKHGNGTTQTFDLT